MEPDPTNYLCTTSIVVSQAGAICSSIKSLPYWKLTQHDMQLHVENDALFLCVFCHGDISSFNDTKNPNFNEKKISS